MAIGYARHIEAHIQSSIIKIWQYARLFLRKTITFLALFDDRKWLQYKHLTANKVSRILHVTGAEYMSAEELLRVFCLQH